MNVPPAPDAEALFNGQGVAAPPASYATRWRVVGYFVYVGCLSLAFLPTLDGLFSLAVDNELHSHTPLIPLISAYLLFQTPLPAPRGQTLFWPNSPLGGLVVPAVLLAVAAFAGWWMAAEPVSVGVGVYVGLVIAGAPVFMSLGWTRTAAFPLMFLAFMIPMPEFLQRGLEDASIAGSAAVAELLFRVTGTPFIRDDTYFTLPGIVLHIAQECSGIRSSWVLLITSVLAARTFLRTPIRRSGLVLFVLPLAIVRNAFRILVIALLCVHVGPHMVDSPIHRQGGPIFFALSLIPLYFLLRSLWRAER